MRRMSGTRSHRSYPGDTNFDRSLSHIDIDLLSAAIRDGVNTKRFDMNGDSMLDLGDHVAWVHDVRESWYGDANLDGEFNSSDMVQVFSVGEYETEENAGWSEGDWNGDGLFDSNDMVTAFVDGGYERGSRRIRSAVPEPAGNVLLLMGLLGMATHVWRTES